MVNPNNTNSEPESAVVQAAGRSIGVQIHVVEASTTEEIDPAITTLVESRAGALLVSSDPLFFFRRNQLIALAARHSLPAIYAWSEAPGAGYGASIVGATRQCGSYIGRILKGENPADLPVVQPTKIELVINLRTAETLGITVPPTLLAQADEVME